MCSIRMWCACRRRIRLTLGPMTGSMRLVNYMDRFENLFLVGRNGMHKYNNQDHSMLTAMTAVDNIVAGTSGESSLWQINTEQEYHEEK